MARELEAALVQVASQGQRGVGLALVRPGQPHRHDAATREPLGDRLAGVLVEEHARPVVCGRDAGHLVEDQVVAERVPAAASPAFDAIDHEPAAAGRA